MVDAPVVKVEVGGGFTLLLLLLPLFPVLVGVAPRLLPPVAVAGELVELAVYVNLAAADEEELLLALLPAFVLPVSEDVLLCSCCCCLDLVDFSGVLVSA